MSTINTTTTAASVAHLRAVVQSLFERRVAHPEVCFELDVALNTIESAAAKYPHLVPKNSAKGRKRRSRR